MSKRVEADYAGVFAALGEPTRLLLVRQLVSKGAQSASALSEGSELTRQAITKHLVVLEEAGLVTRERVGREVLFSLQTEQLVSAQEFLDGIARGWDRALERLRRLVEGPGR